MLGRFHQDPAISNQIRLLAKGLGGAEDICTEFAVSHRTAQRMIEPHGLLLGHRSYLVARQPSRSETILNFRLDRIHAAEVLGESFAFAAGLTLEDYAAQAFGVYQDPAQYGEVFWCFAPGAPRSVQLNPAFTHAGPGDTG